MESPPGLVTEVAVEGAEAHTVAEAPADMDMDKDKNKDTALDHTSKIKELEDFHTI